MSAKVELKHPATFSKPILDQICSIVYEELHWANPKLHILDPFAGTGKIHFLENLDERINTMGVEIEGEWAIMGPPCAYCKGEGGFKGLHDSWDECAYCHGTGSKTICGNALRLSPGWTNHFHVVVTSPTYGNRMADHHNAQDDSKRMTYKHMLGRDLHPDNSGQLHFGPKYCDFHERAWAEVTRVLRTPHPKSWDTPPYPGGMFILNVSNFIRRGVEVDVCQWHYDTIIKMGYDLELERDVPTARLRYGQNHAARVTSEKIFVFRRTMKR